MKNIFGYPALGFGLGLRSQHYDVIYETQPKEVEWFEIISENFIEAHKGYWDFLGGLRENYPIVMHGVSLSIGSTDTPNPEYLRKLKALADFLQPPWVSDHLCWTGVNGRNTHDLLPVPYTEESLRNTVNHIRQVQDILERNIVLENPSTYIEFKASAISEWEFLARMAEEANCGILLDVNNVYVNSFNHGYDAIAYIDAIPANRVVQIHLAGHRNLSTHILDTHDDHVIDEVWKLYAHAIRTKGLVSTMVEWDENIPEFPVLLAELEKAKVIARNPKSIAA